ncbi:MAG: hypothetical protein JKX76_01400 [Colwellia sp.]|nr:hypothetical protein [Colwellia sp.]
MELLKVYIIIKSHFRIKADGSDRRSNLTLPESKSQTGSGLGKLPSVIRANGTQIYYKHDLQYKHKLAQRNKSPNRTNLFCRMGKYHRPSLEGPAVIRYEKGPTTFNMYQAYYENGKLHRPSDQGPAIIRLDGSNEYYEIGERHRPSRDGPAIISMDGNQEYYDKGKRHRPFREGPAIVRVNGSHTYYENNEHIVANM